MHNSKIQIQKEIAQLVIKNHIILKDKTKVYINDLLYIKAEDHYIRVYTADGKNHLVRGKLGDLESQLPPQLCPYSQILYHQSELCKTSATAIFNAYERYANSYLSKTSKGLDIKKPPNRETGGFEY